MINIVYGYGVVDLEDIHPEDLDTVSIAKSLARINRFNGAFNSISVCQHAVLVSKVVENMGGSHTQRMAALHHDDSMAFTGDIPSPLMDECPEFSRYVGMVDDAIEDKFGISLRDPMVVAADNIVGCKELHACMDTEPLMPRYHIRLPKDYMDHPIGQTALVPWSPEIAAARYLERHDSLMVAITKEYNSSVVDGGDRGDEVDKCLS